MNTEIEQARYNLIHSDIENDLLHTRWNVTTLKQHLLQTYGIKSLEDVDESALVSDYAFIAPINKSWGYVDIYYLKIPYDASATGQTLMITEVSVSEE